MPRIDFSRADLHMHSTWSDGTDSPKDLLAKVTAAGIDFFSITDHDEYRGSRLLLLQLKESWNETQDESLPFFIPGTEFSCRDDLGKYHILGYAYQTDSVPIRKLMADLHDIRMLKVTNRLKYLKDKYGFGFSNEEIKRLMRHHNPGKPHIAKLMMKHGFADSVSEAITKYINHYHGPERRIAPEEAIQAILEAGGIPVLAHGPFGDGEQDLDAAEMETRVSRLIRAGLQGVEGYYSGYSPVHQQMMLEIASRHDLLVTAGSDYHGKNKKVLLGDTGPSDNEEKKARLLPFYQEALTKVEQYSQL